MRLNIDNQVRFPMTDRILVDAKEGAALLGISLRTFRYLIKTAGFPAAFSSVLNCSRISFS